MKSSHKLEIKRQSTHFFGIVFVIASYFLGFWPMTAFILLALVCSASHAFLRPMLKKIPVVCHVSDFFDSMARKKEKEKNIYYGATIFFVALLLTFVIFHNQLEIWRTAALILILGDSFSTIAGKLWGKNKLQWNKDKSWEGFGFGFLAAFLGSLTQVSLPLALLIAFIGMFVESLPVKLDDNLTIPISVCIVLWVLL